jgi:hypothetical protein
MTFLAGILLIFGFIGFGAFWLTLICGIVLTVRNTAYVR